MRLPAFAALALFVLAMAPSPSVLLSFDKAAHICAFAVLAVLLRRGGVNLLTIWLGLSLFAAAIEGGQALLPTGRTASWSDFAASCMGVGLGVSPLMRWKIDRAALALLAIACAAQFAYSAARPVIVEALARVAWERGIASSVAQAPWPGAPARIGYRLAIGDSTFYLADSAAMPALAIAPGRLEASAAPGQGFSIFMGHRNRAFHALGDLPLGAPLAVTDLRGRTTRYIVAARDIVRWNQSGLRLTEPPGLALVTCWPVTNDAPSDLRLIVRARPLAPSA